MNKMFRNIKKSMKNNIRSQPMKTLESLLMSMVLNGMRTRLESGGIVILVKRTGQNLWSNFVNHLNKSGEGLL